ncbi:hypothetical protein KAX06_04240 [candidate division WOR-3 bacterium]|jgi:hypothetical protein|nr:hypothetical protein [candidate division WOR-3 bacterium]
MHANEKYQKSLNRSDIMLKKNSFYARIEVSESKTIIETLSADEIRSNETEKQTRHVSLLTILEIVKIALNLLNILLSVIPGLIGGFAYISG